ncbi:MAG: recombinase RecT [Lamprobacter sp.]|uniref:recombinase RecT n=1 Tax=Lamprobacter sp. TaxID=3100796 RepID=UPI002B263B48|nr:recombinase RecT [Lamprobacter sp.]MEA3643097.1 recombinase RecT [Lamprobacter sp.]
MTRSLSSTPAGDQPRIPMPAVDPALNLTPSTWKVLTESIFPAAKTADGILLAVHYCAARNLDIMKRPVHVVPMYSKAQGREIETVWPGIAELQTTAARTGQWAGIDPPRFGPLEECTFRGRLKRDGAWQDLESTVTFPEWCEVTVYRLISGQRCAFTEPVFWLEAYARFGGAYSELPTDMWLKRPRGQLMKCAKAASLRTAFPEEATYTAEEMEGRVIEADAGVSVPNPTSANGSSPRHNPEPSVAESTTPTDEQPPAAVAESTTASVAADAAPPTTALDPALQSRIDRVIARAGENAAWREAAQYLRERCTGGALDYALQALHQAQHADEHRQAA